MQLPKIEQEQEPKGKRSVRQNVWGNYIGYIGVRRWRVFGDAFDAKLWLEEDKNNL